MKKLHSLLLMLFLPPLLFAQETIDPDIAQILSDQEKMVECWNNGDLDGYMEMQWKSDSVIFMGNRFVTKGWDNIYDVYKKGYPTKKSMGKLTITVIQLEKLTDTIAFMIGKYEVEADRGNQSGHFNLLLKKIDGKWLVIVDHSS